MSNFWGSFFHVIVGKKMLLILDKISHLSWADQEYPQKDK